jgi:hypothetical protein
MEAFRNIMLRSSAEQAIKIIEFLNVNNAILAKTNSQLVAIARARKDAKKSKRIINKARVLSKADADQLRLEAEAKEAADIAHKAAMEEKKKKQAVKMAQNQAEKTQRAIQRALAKDTRETNTGMARMARIDHRLF